MHLRQLGTALTQCAQPGGKGSSTPMVSPVRMSGETMTGFLPV